MPPDPTPDPNPVSMHNLEWQAIALQGLNILNRLAVETGTRDRGPRGQMGPQGTAGRDGRDGRPGERGPQGQAGVSVVTIVPDTTVKTLVRSDPRKVARILIGTTPAHVQAIDGVVDWLAGILAAHPEVIDAWVDQGPEAYGRALDAAAAEARR